MAENIKEYDARIDSKKRITLRGASSEFYHVRERKDGTIELSPRILVHPDEISKNTLGMIDSSAKNLKEGRVSEPVNLNELDDLIE